MNFRDACDVLEFLWKLAVLAWLTVLTYRVGVLFG
jgi:hypothetical protein